MGTAPDIDFAHILGDFMKFGAYKREKAPFVFTEYTLLLRSSVLLLLLLCSSSSLLTLNRSCVRSEFVHVMGGAVSDNYQLFVDLGAIAFNILRNNADILISLFVMVRLTRKPPIMMAWLPSLFSPPLQTEWLQMLSAGIPLLRTRKDIKFLESALALHLTEEEAAATFKVHPFPLLVKTHPATFLRSRSMSGLSLAQGLAAEALACKTTRVLFFMHNLAHPD